MTIKPPSNFFFPTEEITKEGIKALQEGKVATVILAGGLGSRLGQEIPKGLTPISPIKKKSLFQLIAEKTIAAEKAYDIMPKLAIMTSEETHKQTTDYFSQADFFGLPSLSFFQQTSLPLLNDEELPVMTLENRPLTAPNGNGLFFVSLIESGIFAEWKNAGIEYINVLPVDNPLADPFSPQLIGLNKTRGDDISVLAVERTDPEESVGLLVEQNERLSVIEYTEMTPEEKKARGSKLKYFLANTSFFTFRLSFIEAIAELATTSMPLHRVKKKLTEAQKKLLGISAPEALWKSEYFIFDLLAFTEKTSALVLNREECFYPLKNGTGSYGPSEVQKALLQKDRKQFTAISGKEIPEDRLFELSMAFYYPTKRFLSFWKDQPLPSDDYIGE